MGMTKLPLHERLRKWADEALSSHDYASIVALEDMNLNSGEKRAAEAKLFYCFANEIERDYTPKAVDANGDVWHIGNPCIIGGKEGIIAGYAYDNCACVWVEDDGGYDFCGGEYIQRPEERTPIEKLRDEMRDYAHGHVPDSVLDGWVKDLTDYIDQQGKDE